MSYKSMKKYKMTCEYCHNDIIYTNDDVKNHTGTSIITNSDGKKITYNYQQRYVLCDVCNTVNNL